MCKGCLFVFTYYVDRYSDRFFVACVFQHAICCFSTIYQSVSCIWRRCLPCSVWSCWKTSFHSSFYPLLTWPSKKTHTQIFAASRSGTFYQTQIETQKTSTKHVRLRTVWKRTRSRVQVQWKQPPVIIWIWVTLFWDAGGFWLMWQPLRDFLSCWKMGWRACVWRASKMDRKQEELYLKKLREQKGLAARSGQRRLGHAFRGCPNTSQRLSGDCRSSPVTRVVETVRRACKKCFLPFGSLFCHFSCKKGGDRKLSNVSCCPY